MMRNVLQIPLDRPETKGTDVGMNYYLHENGCPHCGRGDEPLHIGKSSGGWCFALHVYPDEEVGIKNLDDWRAKWSAPNCRIKDEYGQVITPTEMDEIITARKSGTPPWNEQQRRENHAVAGPNNLVRRELGRFCIGHGEGTWDLLVGDFS